MGFRCLAFFVLPEVDSGLERIESSLLIAMWSRSAIAGALILGTSLAHADCTQASPTGHFDGTAIGKELGKLNLALDLRCVQRRYEGELVTPVGVYIVKAGDFAGGELRLRLEAGADSVEVRAKPERDPVLDWVLQQK